MRLTWGALLLGAVLCCGGGGPNSSTTASPSGGGGATNPTAIKGVFRAPGTAQGLARPLAAASGTVTTTMSTPRMYPGGIKLLDGSLLIFGGSSDTNGVNALASADLFDPGTETFSAVGSMSIPRTTPASTRLSDGRVVIVGGSPINNQDVDVYDPTTKTFTAVTVQGLQQWAGFLSNGKAFTLPGDRVLFFGGQSAEVGTPFLPPQIFSINDPVPTVTTLTDPQGLCLRYGFSSLVLTDGRILVTGGQTQAGTSSDILVVDPVALTVTKVGQMTTPRANHSMIEYPDGTVEVYGGVSWGAGGLITRLSSVEDINLTTWAATKVGNLTQVRSLMESNLLQNGVSLHGGGPDANGFPTDIQLAYTHGTNAAAITSQMVTPRCYFVSLVMNNGRVLYAGGNTSPSGPVTNTAEIFDSYSLVMINGSTDEVVLDPATAPTVQMTLVSGGPVTWSATVGSIDANGLWTAPLWVAGSKTNPVSCRITATSTTDSTVKASFDVKLDAPAAQ